KADSRVGVWPACQNDRCIARSVGGGRRDRRACVDGEAETKKRRLPVMAGETPLSATPGRRWPRVVVWLRTRLCVRHLLHRNMRASGGGPAPPGIRNTVGRGEEGQWNQVLGAIAGVDERDVVRARDAEEPPIDALHPASSDQYS